MMLSNKAIKEIRMIVNNISREDILAIASKFSERIKTDSSLISIKDKQEFVTQADIEIQEYLLNYFANSEIGGQYLIKAEEESKTNRLEQNPRIKQWQLVIDPLDGTSTFCKGDDKWGVMIGICDDEGVLRYSWNLLSTGDVYEMRPNRLGLSSFRDKIQKNKQISIDVYDYGAGYSEKFGKIFANITGINPSQFTQTSYPSAVWVGWQLFTNKLDGLLWLPSNTGKNYYPDYDLIFLGALKSIGYKIKLGKLKNNNAIIAVASTAIDLENLWKTGIQLLPKDLRKQIFITKNPLEITEKINTRQKDVIAIIDFGAGNLKSVQNAMTYLKMDCKIASNPKDIEAANRIILPGVGSFGFMMSRLRKLKLEDPIKKAIESGKPYLGICLGLQALFEESEESPGIRGLSVFKGKVVKFKKGKIPQIGWNRIKSNKGLFAQGYAYFVNSYYPVPENKIIIAATTDYYGEFVSAVQEDNITAVQFHPEKSGRYGLALLERWLQC